MHPERILQLALGHFRPALDTFRLRFRIKLLSRAAVAFASAGRGGLPASGRALAGIAARHLARALTLAISADMRLTFALLLAGSALRFLLLGAAEIAAIAPRALVFGRTGFL